MAITPQPGFMIDPQNANAVIPDPNYKAPVPPVPTPPVPVPADANPNPPVPTPPAPTPVPTPQPPTPAAVPTPQPPAPTPTPEAKVYNVLPGDTILKIAQKFGVKPSEISGYRSGDPNKIMPGESLTIGNPAPKPTPTPTATPPTPTPTDLGGDLQKFFTNVFGQNGDALQFGFNTNPTKTVKDLVTEVMQATGLPDVSANINDISKQIEDLQNEQNDEVNKINDDPFLSAGSKKERIDALDAKYSARIDARTNRLKLLQGAYDDARQQAQFAATTAISLFDKNRNFDESKLEYSLSEAEKYLSAQSKSSKDTQVIEANGRKLLIDSSTGETVKDLGSANSASSAGTTRSGKLVYSGEDYSSDSSALEKSRGSDGWVDPSVYKRLYDGWISGGGSTKDFIAKFPPKIYVNPANDWLPPILRNTSTNLADQIDSVF